MVRVEVILLCVTSFFYPSISDKPKAMIKEACVETYEECLSAIKNGADQLEVCSHMELDGLTPDKNLIKKLITASDVPIKVMIRSRGGNFTYTKQEISEMVKTIRWFKKLPISGFVFGALKQDAHGNSIIDLHAVKKICSTAAPFPITFHKAIDLCDNIIEEAEKLKIFANVRFILTSGGQSTAEEGANTLIKMQDALFPKIQIIAAGKVTSQNLESLKERLGVEYFHGRRIV